MNAVEIEQAIAGLAEQPYAPAEFPYAFLEAFDSKATTTKRLRAGVSNKPDVGGAPDHLFPRRYAMVSGRTTSWLTRGKTK